MLKLYYAPGACSLNPHIALREAGVPFELVRVDFMRGRTLPDGSTFASVWPKAYVPALRLENDEMLGENAVMVQYIADLAPEKKLVPAAGTFERVRLQERLVFISTELHKGLSPLFNPKANEEYLATVKERLENRFQHLATLLEGKPWLMGEQFTVADGYALWCLRTWEKMAKVDLASFPVLAAYRRRIEERPAVKEALAAEGLA